MTATFVLSGQSWRIAPSMKLALEIEEELGGIADLAARLSSGRWRAGELVALVHILMAAAGRGMDFARLGDAMIADGLAAHAQAAEKFLNLILDGATA